MKVILGISFSAFLTFIVAAWYFSIGADGKDAVNVASVSEVVKGLYELNLKSLDVGFFKYVLMVAPVFGLVALIINMSNFGVDFFIKKPRPIQCCLFEEVSIYESFYLYTRRFFDRVSVRLVNFIVKPAYMLDTLVKWVFLKFVATIVGAYLGFVCASYYINEIGFKEVFVFIFYAFIIYVVIYFNFYYYKLFGKLFPGNDFYVLIFGVFWILFMAFGLGG